MRKLLGTLAAALAIVVLPAMNDDPHGVWDSGGDRAARSLPGSDHASAAELEIPPLAPEEERSRGSV